jgi:hypothetical protein
MASMSDESEILRHRLIEASQKSDFSMAAFARAVGIPRTSLIAFRDRKIIDLTFKRFTNLKNYLDQL